MALDYPDRRGRTPGGAIFRSQGRGSDEGALTADQVQPHHRPPLAGADLDEVAELVGKPKPAATLLREVWAQPSNQRLLDPAPVLHLGKQPAILDPEAQDAGSAPVR